jgi:hypothetical protein
MTTAGNVIKTVNKAFTQKKSPCLPSSLRSEAIQTKHAARHGSFSRFPRAQYTMSMILFSRRPDSE